MATITAKVQCNLKQVYTYGESSYATLGFMPNYTAGANAQWANATPTLHYSMTVKGEVAEHFEPGRNYVVTFEADGTEYK